MSINPFLSDTKLWTSGLLPQPWPNNSVSLYGYIIENLDPETKRLSDTDITLPDEPEPNENQLRWIAGGMEGAFGHHGGNPNDTALSGQIFTALKQVLSDPSAQNVSKFYDLIKKESALDYIDDLIKLIAKNSLLRDEKLKKFAIWLATKAPDRGPVKVGIAFIGITTSGEAEDLILLLGQHEEFSLYAVVALENSADDPEMKIWGLAKTLKCWGRIQAVERLKDTRNEDIKAWLLTEGFRNGVMDEYLAYFCAEKGNLLAALNKQYPNVSVVAGARDIIRALIAGGPGEDISDYIDGPEVIKRYLELAADCGLGIPEYLAAADIQRLVTDTSYDWNKAVGAWTVDIRNEISKLAKDILDRPDWNYKIEAGLNTNDNAVFRLASRAANLHGIDAWEMHLEKIKADPKRGFWWEVMQSNDYMRIQRVVDLATELLPLHEIATGASDILGLGEKYWAHSSLGFILQDLGKFPRVGWNLIKAGLQSPVTRNRNAALNALAAWPRAAWPQDANTFLTSAKQHEVVSSVKDTISNLIAGQDVDPQQ